MPLRMLGSMGSGCAMLGGALLLVAWLPRATRPLVTVGQTALTVYVVHLLLPAASEELVRRASVPDAFLAAGVFAVLVACGCVLWRAVFSRGPLEAAVGAPWWIVEKFLPARESADGDRKTKDREDRAPGMAARTAHDGQKGNPL